MKHEFIAALLLGAFTCTPSVSAAEQRVWIFTGVPGDAEHHADFEKTLGSLKSGFTTRLGVSPEDITIYYGPKTAGYAGEATRENMLAALSNIAAITRESPRTAHWIVFIGHAHAIRGGAQLNLPGPDLNSIDLTTSLAECNPEAPLTLVFTHTASAPFLRPLAAPGRVIITATAPGGIENETEFPSAMAEAIHDPAADANKDGNLDATEIFLATRERVLGRYKAESLIVREAALLDGDGDGRGTQRPAEADATGAARRSFILTSEAKGLE